MSAVRIVINATAPRGPAALPVLLESLHLNNVPMHTVTVVCPGELPQLPAARARTDFNAGSLTGLVHAAESGPEEWPEDWVLYLHETMVAGDSFLSRLSDLAGAAAGLHCVTLSKDVHGCNAGLYSLAWLRTLGLERLRDPAAAVHIGEVAARCDPERRRFMTAEVQDVGEFRYSEADPEVLRIRWHPELDVYEFRQA